jgi:tetratricopeptide (TPR) repeat protein
MAENSVMTFDEVLWRPDGSRRPREEAIALVGNRGVWVAELREELLKREGMARPLSVPRRIFLSYRWGTPEDDAWVERLAEELTSRGNVVTFDRWAGQETSVPTVPELVARIADCHQFVSVIDPGYVERLGRDDARTIQDGWVFDEHQVACGLSNGQRVQIVGLLRAGDDLPQGFRLVGSGKPGGNTFDVRDAGALPAVVEALFPPLEPPPPPELATRLTRLLDASQGALVAGRFDEAYEVALEAAQSAPNLVDGYAQMARAAYFGGHAPEGFRAATAALAIDPLSFELLEIAAQCAYYAGEPREAIKLCVRVLPHVHSETVHIVLGNALDDLGQVYAGLAHLEIARALVPQNASLHNATGFAYRHAGQLHKALACFAQGLEVSPTDQMLLVNQAATAIEAGDPVLAEEALDRLAGAYPGHESLGYLSGVYERWRAEGGVPPALVPRIPPRDPIGILRCTECALDLPLASAAELLCAGCGAERFGDSLTCELCGSDGTVMPMIAAQARWLCPYCRNGFLTLERP